MSTRILVVDDEPAIRELVAEYLRGRGLEVAVAPDAERACAALEEDRPDIVLTDLKLPAMDGIGVLRAATAAGVPGVLMTGYGTVETAIEAFAAGARDYVLKPFRLRELHGVLLRALDAAARDRRRAWAEGALALVVDADNARTAAEAEALVPRLIALVGGQPGGEHVALRGEASGQWRRLGESRWIDLPQLPEAWVLASAVHAALVRAGR
jgi:DNA-binding NtrC family response regulator